MMDLDKINDRMEKIILEMSAKLPQLRVSEWKYDKRFYQLILSSGIGNQAGREAEAKLTCDAEGLFSPLADLRGEVRALINEKEMLTEISKNIRSLMMSNF